MEKWWYNNTSYVSLSDGRISWWISSLSKLGVIWNKRHPTKLFLRPAVIWNHAEEPAIGRAAKMSGMQFTPGPDEVLDMVEDQGFWILLAWKFICFAAEIFHPLERGIWSNLKFC